MPNDLWTIGDSIADALDLAEREVTDVLNDSPFVAMLPADKSSNGTNHKYPKRIGAPVVGFRKTNKGRDMSKSQDSIVSIDLAVLDYSWAVDKAIADIWRKGGSEAFIAREGLAHVGSALFKYEQQLWYGQLLGQNDGFTGMMENATVLSKTAAMSVDAGGSSADAVTSVWAIRVGENDVMGIYNGDGEVTSVGETFVQLLQDDDGRFYPGYVTPACTWLAMQVGSAYSFGRICNLSTQNGHTLNDDLISKLIALFPAGRRPTHLMMNRQSQQQLQDSRTATNETGKPAPFPEDSFGFPIVTTDSILNTEPLAV